MKQYGYKYCELMAEDEGLYITHLVAQRGAVTDGE